MAEDHNLRFVQQTFDLWINPEIERRRKAGSLPSRLTLHSAQVIMNVDADAPEIRLNDEVRAVLKVRATRRVKKGEQVTATDFDDIEGIELTHADPNAGHITLVLHDGSWYLSFDFRYNAERIGEHVEAAQEFLDCSRFALGQRQLRAFVDNLFSATELIAKSLLLMTPDRTMLTAKRLRRGISRKYNLWSKLGNTEQRYAGLLNRLGDLRGSARYLRSDLRLTPDEAKGMLDVAEQMLSVLRTQVPNRIKVKNRKNSSPT